MKTLAGAVRFGTPLLVENVEKLDPVLNPILNKEIQRTGGRSLVRIGTEEVDYSPKFNSEFRHKVDHFVFFVPTNLLNLTCYRALFSHPYDQKPSGETNARPLFKSNTCQLYCDACRTAESKSESNFEMRETRN